MKLRRLLLITAAAAAIWASSLTPALATAYTVQPGDSLYLIGRHYGLSAEAVRAANRLPGPVIYPGQVLWIPDITYTVRPGDTLFTIGRRYGVSYNELARVNGLNPARPIYPGQVLYVPRQPVTNVSRGAREYVIPCTDAERDLLARLITAEAAAEPYTAQVAVGAVVVNRVKSPAFPNTISQVIYQVWDGHYQFTPVLNGWINRPATDTARRAAEEALQGVDPTGGAVYFYTPPIDNRYLLARPVSTQYGGMVYTF